MKVKRNLYYFDPSYYLEGYNFINQTYSRRKELQYILRIFYEYTLGFSAFIAIPWAPYSNHGRQRTFPRRGKILFRPYEQLVATERKARREDHGAV